MFWVIRPISVTDMLANELTDIEMPMRAAACAIARSPSG